ncbi:Leucine-rich repeat receptor-like protein kinase family protein [Euphorbia peplus]|nr:Leucine-rich repeat receptor-like protein kinase family protein [Euphorbia peplus]
MLHNLDLSHDSISGELPLVIGNMTFWSLDLSHNNLSGTIPVSLPHFNWSYIDLQYNSLEGKIPERIWPYRAQLVGNEDLCYDNLNIYGQYFPSQTRKDLMHYIKIFPPITMFLVFLLLYKRKVNGSQIQPKSIKNGDLFSILNFDGQVAYEDIIKATENFSVKYCIGVGGHGNVYKAQLLGNRTVALKKLRSSKAVHSLVNEVKVLTEIRHRNIGKLYGFCLHRRSVFLIYEYMEKGSLFGILRNAVKSAEMNWVQRVNIIKDIADAFSYLHHDCTPPIAHRDILSKNILLNLGSKASISDFGVSRLLDPDSSNRTRMAGTMDTWPQNLHTLQW